MTAFRSAGRALHHAYTDQALPGAGGPTAIATVTVPAGLLGANGDRLHVSASGRFAANANPKAVALAVAGNFLGVVGAASSNAAQWNIDLDLVRTAAATARYRTAALNAESAAGNLDALQAGVSGIEIGDLAGLDFTAAVALTVQAVGGAANDVICSLLTAELWRAP